jgi:hypothetical protein
MKNFEVIFLELNFCFPVLKSNYDILIQFCPVQPCVLTLLSTAFELEIYKLRCRSFKFEFFA